MKISELVNRGAEQLARAGIQCADPKLHIKQILGHCLSTDIAALYRRWDEEVSPETLACVDTFVERRAKGEPFQYIAGEEWFWDAAFSVGPGVLIPRKETEILVETLLSADKRERVTVAELGGGSGNIGITALRQRPRWTWRAFELNPESLPFLERNRRHLLPADAVYEIVPGDFFDHAGLKAPYDWIVSNPPYVTSGEWDGLAREVRHEPRLALDGGADGLDVIRRLVASAREWLKPEGRLLGEMAGEQGEAVEKILKDADFSDVKIIRDYAGLSRIFQGTWRGRC